MGAVGLGLVALPGIAARVRRVRFHPHTCALAGAGHLLEQIERDVDAARGGYAIVRRIAMALTNRGQPQLA
jgi:hypothetical protein